MRGASLSAGRGIHAATVAAAIAASAIAVGFGVAEQPLVAGAIPFVLLTALLCARRPAGAIALILVFCGTFGSLQAFGLFSPGPFVDLLLGGLWISVIVSHIVKQRTQPWWIWPGLAIVCVYIVLTLFEIPTAETLYLGLRSFRFSTWYMTALPLLAFAGWTLATYDRIAKAVLAAAFLIGAYAMLRLVIGEAADERTFAVSEGAGSYNLVDGELPLIGSFPARHSLAFWGVGAVPFCLAAALTRRRRWRLIAVAAAGMCAAAVMGTEVRAAIPALVAGAATVIVLYQFASGLGSSVVGRTTTALMAALVGGAILFSMVIGESSSRYTAIFDPTQDSAYQARVAKWKQAVEDIDDRPFGKGLGTAGLVQERGEGPFITQGSYGIDSSYLKVAYEQGFAVMGFFIVAMLALLAGLIRGAFATRHEVVRGMLIGGAGALVASLVMFVTGQYIENLPALTLWIMIGSGAGGMAALRSAPPDAGEGDDEGTPARAERAGPSPVIDRASSPA